MKQKDSFFKKLLSFLSDNKDSSAEEMLKKFIKEQKHATLLERIKAIRTNSFFVPDYNKPKVFTEVKILYKKNSDSDFQPISHETKLAHERPEDFGNDIKAWKKFVNRDHKRATTHSALKEKEEKFQKLMRSKFEKLQPFFNRMMRVD